MTNRVTVILPLLALCFACSDELRPVTPFGYYEATPERPAASPNLDPQDTELGIEPFVGSILQEEPEVSWGLGDTFAPQGRPAHIDGQSWRPGINGVGRHFRRRVIGDEVIVGLHCEEAHCLATSAAGGVFKTTPFGDWYPLPTTLPPLSRSFAVPGGIVACPASGTPGFGSRNRGRSWAQLEYSCGQNGRRTVASGTRDTVVIVGQQLRVGDAVIGSYRMIPSPVIAPTALAARGETFIVFGAREMALSEDGGETFELLDPPRGLLEVYDAALGEKGLLALAGRAGPGGAPLLMSLDTGRTWQDAPVLPDRINEYHAVLIDKQRRIVASSHLPDSGAIFSADMGRRWAFMEASIPLRGAITRYRRGALMGTVRGIAVAMDARGVFPMGLDQPLADMLFLDPMRAVAVGVYGGLYRSIDAGHTWYAVPGTRGLPFTHIAETDGVVMAVGPGVHRWSDSAGRIWRFGTSTTTCTPAWMEARGGGAMIGCLNGEVTHSQDLGRTWQAGHAPAPLTMVVWMSEGAYWLGVSPDGEGYFSSTDGGATWHETDGLTSHRLRLLSSTDAGISVVTSDQRIGTIRDAAAEIEWLTAEITDRFVDVVQTQAIDGDQLLVLDRHGLWLTDPTGETHLLVGLYEATAFRLVGDGGVVLIGRHATTHLTRVR